MGEHRRKEQEGSRPEWATLDEWVREQVRGFVQEALEDEVTEFLGRSKSERRASVDAGSGYRNGYGKPRRLTCSTTTCCSGGLWG
jgi:transposase-like protein